MKVIVTGGAGSIGKTVANYMAAAGADIAIFDLNKEPYQKAADEIASIDISAAFR